MKNILTIIIFIVLNVTVFAQQTLVVNELMADATQAKRFEVAWIYIDVANWNQTGHVEINLFEKYYKAGLKKSYMVSYGYGIGPQVFLTNMSGFGVNTFRVALGSEIVISGSIKYVPVYIDVMYYSRINATIETNATLTTNASNTSQGYVYYNLSPSGVNIADFPSDASVRLADGASSTILSGNVLIGKTSQVNSGYILDVDGVARANEIKVNTSGADFVFEEGYKLRSLSETEQFIKLNKHLPEIETAAEMKENGVRLGELNTKLLQKIEELTLYMIEQGKELNTLRKLNEAMSDRLGKLENN